MSGTDSRTWNYTYGTFGKLLTMTEPTGAVTTYAYYADNHSTVNLRGMPYTVTNPLSQKITINLYTSQGLPSNISLLNGLTKSMTYDFRGRMLTETTVDGTDTYVYDAEGQPTQVTFSNGYVINMTYDNDHRLTGLSDNRSNSIVYTLDANGNATNESEYTSSTLVSVKNKVFDGLSRMTQSSRASSAFPYTYTYDALNRVTNIENPNADSQAITYDNKNNVADITGMGRNQYATRDSDGNVTNLSQQGNSTTFTYNGLGEMLNMVNPDTGTHTYTYDVPKKTVTHTDNAGVTHTMVYDGIGRLLTDSTTTTSITYTWDTVKDGKLTSIADSSGSTVYSYNSSARLTSKTHNIGSYSKSLGYAYNTAGQLNKTTYPSSMEVNYQYTNGVLSGLQIGTTTLLNNIGYKGFGSMPVSWTWGNTNTRALSINTSQRITGLTDSAVINQSITQDNVDNVTAVTDSANANNAFTATYTTSEQVSNFSHTLGNQDFTQDSKFNLNTIMPFDSTYNQLYFGLNSGQNSINTLIYGGSVYQYPTHDVKGNMTVDGASATFSYDVRNNMVSANKINPATYTYNALHQRVSKTVTVGSVSTTTYFVYDEQGLLIGEYNSSGTAIAEHIYLGSTPVAVVKGGNIYYVHTDYLGTPRTVTSTANTVMWKWDNTNAYGFNVANETVSGPLFEYNIRFAGQYFDKEYY